MPSNNWTLIACDSGNSNTCISNPAIILYNVHVPGAITTTSTVLLYTEMQLQPSGIDQCVTLHCMSLYDYNVILDTTSPQITVYLTEQHNNMQQQLLVLVVVGMMLTTCVLISLFHFSSFTFNVSIHYTIDN